MLRLVHEAPPADELVERLAADDQEAVELWRALEDAHRAIAKSGLFKLKYRLEQERAADEIQRRTDAYVAHAAGAYLAEVPAPEPGPFIDDLDLTPLARGALARNGYRTIERARAFVLALPDDVENADLPPRIGLGIVAMLREALAQWDELQAPDDGAMQ